MAIRSHAVHFFNQNSGISGSWRTNIVHNPLLGFGSRLGQRSERNSELLWGGGTGLLWRDS